MNKLLSVIIPVYNAETYIVECVESIIKSGIKNLEIILVDDGSKDNSMALCEQLSIDHEQLILYSKENGGSASARNYGLQRAKGDYIAFVDSDDTVVPEEYYQAFNETVKNDYDIGCFNLILNNKSVSCKELSNIWEEFISYPVYMHSPCNKFIKNELVKNILFDEDLVVCEDMLFCVKTFLKASSIGYINRNAYLYRIVLESVTHSTSNIKKIRDDIEAANRLKHLVDYSTGDVSLHRFIAYRYQIAALRHLTDTDVFSLSDYRSCVLEKNAYKDLHKFRHRMLCWSANNRLDFIPIIYIKLRRLISKIR